MRAILIGPDEPLNHELASALAAFPEIELTRQIAEYPEPEELQRIIRARRPDFVFLSVQDFARFQALAAAIDDRLPGLPVVGLGREVDPLQLIPQLMHLGVREFLTAPVTPEKLGQAIASVAQVLSKHPAPVVRLADLYAFLPAKPGVGSSTITVSTSCALAEELGVHTLLLDCDLMAGVTKFLLKLGNSSSIVNAMEQADNLDEDLWGKLIGRWGKLEVLHAGELAPPLSLKSSSLDLVLAQARGQYDTICADLASSLDPFSVQIMHEARRIFLVTTPEVVPMHMAAERLRHLRDLGLADKVSLLLNRKNPGRSGLTDAEVGQLVGLRVAHQFSNDYPGVQSAILEGAPVSYRSGLGHSIMSLARSIAPDAARHEPHDEHHKFLEFFHVATVPGQEGIWHD